MANRELEININDIVEYMLKTKSSIRATALHFGCSKTFIWSKLKEYNGKEKENVDALLTNNKINSQKQLNEKRN